MEKTNKKKKQTNFLKENSDLASQLDCGSERLSILHLFNFYAYCCRLLTATRQWFCLL